MAVCKGGFLVLFCPVDHVGAVKCEQAVCAGEAEYNQLPTRIHRLIRLSASRVLERDCVHHHKPDGVQEAMGPIVRIMLLQA